MTPDDSTPSSTPALNAAAASAVAPPVIRVESGNPTAEEVAALVTVLAALGGGPEPEAGTRRSAWSDPSRRLLGPEARAGGWRASGLPH